MESLSVPLMNLAPAGRHQAADTLFDQLYAELHRLAKRQLVRHGWRMTLSPTTLLHQTYIDVAERTGLAFPDHAHFLSYAARVMRGLVIDYARHRQVQKRGGNFEFTSLPADAAEPCVDYRELSAIGETLDELADVDAALAEIVDLKFFCGFSFAEIAAMRNVSERTVQRNWEKARLYLHHHIRPQPAA
jgi:RNA polymerase sigma factor (TIGR02999 family)